MMLQKIWTKKINDMFIGEDFTDWINTMEITGSWATLDNTTKIDWILKIEYRDKYLAEEYQQMNNSDISTYVEKFLSNKSSVLDKLYATTTAEYNPIENYNMVEEGSDSGESSASGSNSDSSTSYNSSTANLTDCSESSSSASSSSSHSLTRSGNIGVTTTQQMLQQERDVAEYDFLHHVAELIIDNFTQSLYDPNEVMTYDSYFI